MINGLNVLYVADGCGIAIQNMTRKQILTLVLLVKEKQKRSKTHEIQ